MRLSTIDQDEPVERPTIVVPFVLSDGSIIRALQNGLTNLGFARVDIQYQTLGKHSYTTNNVGVYLPSAETKRKSTHVEDLAQTYASECPHFDAELTLFSQGEALLEIYGNGDVGVDFISQSLKGTWELFNERLQIELLSSEPLFYNVLRLHHESSTRLDLGIILEGENNKSIFADCNFSSVGYVLKNQSI